MERRFSPSPELTPGRPCTGYHCSSYTSWCPLLTAAVSSPSPQRSSSKMPRQPPQLAQSLASTSEHRIPFSRRRSCLRTSWGELGPWGVLGPPRTLRRQRRWCPREYQQGLRICWRYCSRRLLWKDCSVWWGSRSPGLVCSRKVRSWASEEHARFHAGEKFGGEWLLSAGYKSGTIIYHL